MVNYSRDDFKARFPRTTKQLLEYANMLNNALPVAGYVGFGVLAFSLGTG